MKKIFVAFSLFVSCAGFIVFAVTPVWAAIIDIDTSVGVGADSYISTWPGETNSNFGTQDTFYLKNDSGTGFVNRKGYLRFDLSPVTGSVLDTKLSLSFIEDTHTSNAIWGFNVYGLNDGHAGENWSETGITWNNAPANNTSSGSGLLGGQAALLGSFSINTATLLPGDTIGFSSPDLLGFVQSDSNDLVSLILIRQNRTLSNVGFATKEHLSFPAPTLTLTTSVNPVPAPNSGILLGLGVLCLVRLFRPGTGSFVRFGNR